MYRHSDIIAVLSALEFYFSSELFKGLNLFVIDEVKLFKIASGTWAWWKE